MSLVFAVLLVSAAAAADAQPVATPEASPPAEAPKKVKEKKICKADDPDPGSHMSKRVCRTAAEWTQQSMYGSSRSGMTISGEKLEDH